MTTTIDHSGSIDGADAAGVGPWTPLLDGALRAAALRAATEITDGLARWRAEPSPLLDGDAGQAILFARAARAGIAPGGEALAIERLGRAAAALGGAPHAAGLWDGVAGTAWALAHLADGEEADASLGALAERLIERVERAPLSIDLVGGLVGIGVVALERPAHPSARRVAAAVVARLIARAEPRADGVGWSSRPDELPAWQRARSPAGHEDLGLAHGTPGVIGLLARMVGSGLEVERARPLLVAAVAGLLAAAPRPPGAPGGCYPTWIARGGAAAGPPARLAWCYGDLGVACALLAAARATGDPAWEAAALALARAAAGRSGADAGVGDAGMCHGAAGVAHIFNRLGQASGDRTLVAAARTWYECLLAMRVDDLPLGGFRAARVDGQAPAGPEPSLLGGATGVALALLAAATDDEPSWDRALLVDLAPGRRRP